MPHKVLVETKCHIFVVNLFVCLVYMHVYIYLFRIKNGQYSNHKTDKYIKIFEEGYCESKPDKPSVQCFHIMG